MCPRYRCRARTVNFQEMVYRPKTEFDRDPRAGRGRTRVALEEWDRLRPRLLLDRDLETFACRLANMVGPDGHQESLKLGRGHPPLPPVTFKQMVLRSSLGQFSVYLAN